MIFQFIGLFVIFCSMLSISVSVFCIAVTHLGEYTIDGAVNTWKARIATLLLVLATFAGWYWFFESSPLRISWSM